MNVQRGMGLVSEVFKEDVLSNMKGNLGIGCISDYVPEPLIVRSHHGTYAIATVSNFINANEIVEKLLKSNPLIEDLEEYNKN